jgi:glycosyltransferase involved in cell wall biosynthesis
VQPKLSIITVCLNAENTIEATIESVLAQTFKNTEYLIVDGTSTDGTLEILRRYQEQNALKFISEADDGIYYAMNKGVQMARGEWIYFIGSDDVFTDEGVLERIFTKVDDKVEVVYGNVQFLHSGVIYDGPFDHEKISQKNICHQALFVKKTVFGKIGLFNTKYMMSADREFNLRWMGAAVLSMYINETIAVFNEQGRSGNIWDQALHYDLDTLLIENNIVSKRSFAALKKMHEKALYSHRYKVGNFLVTPISWLKNKLLHNRNAKS